MLLDFSIRDSYTATSCMGDLVPRLDKFRQEILDCFRCLSSVPLIESTPQVLISPEIIPLQVNPNPLEYFAQMARANAGNENTKRFCI